LRGLDDPAYIGVVLPLLKADQPDVQIWAIRAVGRMGVGERARDVAALLKDAEPQVRLAALLVVGRLRSSDTQGAIGELIRDPVAAVREAAVIEIGRLGAVEQAGALAALLEDRTPSTRRIAAGALARLGAAEHVEAVARELEASAPGYHLRETGLALVRLACADPPEDVRRRTAARLEPLIRSKDEDQHLAARIARLVLADAGVEEQRALLAEVPTVACDRLHARALHEALSRLHEPAAYAALHRRVRLPADVRSGEDVAAFLAREGLRLKPPPEARLSQPVPAGAAVRGRELLEELAPGELFVVEGNELREASAREAIEAWRARLRD
jgi:hypothetical protein